MKTIRIITRLVLRDRKSGFYLHFRHKIQREVDDVA